MDDVVPAEEIVRAIDAELPLEPADPNYTGEVAERWRYRDGGGEIGVIASVTQAFCRDCSRARLSTDGRIYTCLFANEGYDLRALVRGAFAAIRPRQAIRSRRVALADLSLGQTVKAEEDAFGVDLAQRLVVCAGQDGYA
jgi:molybdenum cofactor biosynthesis enzyme MoaA